MLIDSIKHNRLKKAIIFLLFLFASVIIINMFPREGKLMYEFHRGKPWKNEVLVAPFDIPIYKDEYLLEAERDSALKFFVPFYRLDTLVIRDVLGKFAVFFENEWEGYSEKLASHDKSAYSVRVRGKYFEEFKALLITLYNRGIVSDALQFESITNTSSSINIITGQVVEEKDKSSVFTQISAYQFMNDRLSEISEQVQPKIPVNSRFLQNSDLASLIQPNLLYDNETSTIIRNKILNNISETEGMIQAGEKIIALGELINDEKYQILQSLKREYETNPAVNRNYNYIRIGQIFIICFTFLVLFLFLFHFRQEVLQSTTKTSFILLIIVIMAFLSNVIIKSQELNLYVMPLVILPIIMRTFFDSRIALFVHIITILIISFWAPNSFEFLYMNFIAGVIAIFTLRNIYRRGILFITAVITLLTYSSIYLGINIMQNGSLDHLNLINFAWFGGNALLVLTTYPLIYFFEKLFGFISDATLLELSDTNQPLLRELAEKAPGTFHHSLQVANLAEEAALKTGGNPLLIRCGALYHDIGKLNDPMYYIENMTTSFNPHEEMEFEESADKIIGHVAKGEKIARNHKIPRVIIDFILSHHGTTTVQYFYKSYLKEFPDTKTVKQRFSYPGPIPFSKETAIVMMADSIEAASRSLKNINKESINDLVEQIFKYQFDENQFINSNFTLKDIEITKQVFKNKLQNIYHTRVEYPK